MASDQQSDRAKSEKSDSLMGLLAMSSITLMGMLLLGDLYLGKGLYGYNFWRSPATGAWDGHPVDLAMRGGDPYIRALMRTISASESSDPQPYSILYGGQYIADLSRHPDQCIPIVAGPNLGDCTTAAGRYQFLTTTWEEKARDYHPRQLNLLFWNSYSFEPQFQDQVVYAWLSDPNAWGVDLAELLRDGQIAAVLEILSGTWTSLGYGIESNAVTDALPQIYQDMLQEELQVVSNSVN